LYSELAFINLKVIVVTETLTNTGIGGIHANSFTAGEWLTFHRQSKPNF
jgi:hypothetical protein